MTGELGFRRNILIRRGNKQLLNETHRNVSEIKSCMEVVWCILVITIPY